jgi:ribose/xylose/arabinose/galactoside ABC-type transport system permease subunit
MTLTPSILLMVIGATVTTGSEKAGAGMFLGGFILAILALVWLGPNSYQMDVANGHVMIIRRHCIVRASALFPQSCPCTTV